ncbi:hypothetical protein ACLOJK_027451 [Asimina triloba]
MLTLSPLFPNAPDGSFLECLMAFYRGDCTLFMSWIAGKLLNANGWESGSWALIVVDWMGSERSLTVRCVACPVAAVTTLGVPPTTVWSLATHRRWGIPTRSPLPPAPHCRPLVAAAYVGEEARRCRDLLDATRRLNTLPI